MSTDPDKRALQQAQSQLQSIREMVAALNAESDEQREAAQSQIQEDPLSVEVRTDWFTPGSTDVTPAEFRILLCTGGPAVQIIGELDHHGQPEAARLQYQDWFTPWEDCELQGEDEEALLTYAQQFYFTF
jgi:hypothetical protein